MAEMSREKGARDKRATSAKLIVKRNRKETMDEETGSQRPPQR